MEINQRIALLLRGTTIYVIGDLSARALGFLLVPILTRYLTPSEYGLLEILKSLISVLAIVGGLGLAGAVTRHYYDYPDPETRETYLGTVAGVLIVTTIVLATIVSVAGANLWARAVPDIPFPYFRLAIWTLVANTAAVIPLTIYRARHEPLRSVAVQLAMALANFGCVLYFVVWRDEGAFGKLWGEFVGATVMCIPIAALALRQLRLRFSVAMARRALAYSLPLVPHSLFWWVVDLSDRLILNHYGTLADVGVYAVGYNLSMVMIVAIGGFHSAWAPQFYSQVSRSDPGRMRWAAVVGQWYLSALLASALALSVFSQDIVAIFGGPAYREAWRVMPLVVTAYVFTGAHMLFAVQIMAAEASYLMPVVTGVVMVVNIALNLWLVPAFGMMGAAWATLIATTVFGAVTFVVAQRVYWIPYASRRITGAFATYFVFLVAGGRLASFEGAIVAKLAVVAGFALCAIAVGGIGPFRALWVALLSGRR